MSTSTSFKGWNYGDIFDAVDKFSAPDATALIHGNKVTTWSEFAKRTNNLAQNFINDDFQPLSKIAFYVRNHPAYSEGVIAAFKSRLTHVNVNYRYNAEEVNYILSNSDSEIIIFGREFSPLVSDIKGMENDIRLWLYVEDGSNVELPDFAVPFEAYASKGDGQPLDIERSPDDEFFMYTGGTTGMPKGVMWSQHDLCQILMPGLQFPRIPTDVEDYIQILSEIGPSERCLIACPMMHGTGIYTAFGKLSTGGAAVTMPSPSLDAEELWKIVEQQKVQSIILVGDAFSRPLVKLLDEDPDRFDLSSMQAIGSSGIMWSQELKQALLRHMPNIMLVDSFGSSEGMGLGSSVTTAETGVKTANFMIGPGVKVLTEDGREIEPGTGEVGLIARGAPIPKGYYKDPEKTAKTFKTINGERYSVPGDFCTVDANGVITLLGRGSGCINTGGEKVFPEEVEEALKLHKDVSDALVVGVQDEQWGQAVMAVVEMRSGANADEQALRAHVRQKLAGYKVPKRVTMTDKMFRAPNGKADYKTARKFVEEQISIPAE